MPTADQPSYPRKVLLATDLSARCDRAFDRAADLCEEWQGTLVVAHALEPEGGNSYASPRNVPSWRRAAHEAVLIAQRQVREDLLDREIPFEVYIEESEPVEFMLRLVQETQCELIVTGTARSETLGRFLLGKTVERIARHSFAPILVVKTRPRHMYRTALVATDFSDTSRTALITTSKLFPDATITLVHCTRTTLGGLSDQKSGGGRQLAQLDCEAFLGTIPSELRHRLAVLIEEDGLENVVDAFFADKGLDLLVLGSKGRGAIAHALLGSTADRLLSTARCDVLVVPSVASLK
jgi:nucleotide-binding universal stress UspA family protein